MLLSDLVLAVIAQHGGECRGRTRLQKEVYFLRQPLSVEVIYQPHYYGPYSAELAATVQSLVAEGLMKEEQGLTPSEGPCERVTYTYRLTRDGQDVVDAWKQGAPEEAERLRAVFGGLDLASQRPQKLAVAAKIHHIVSASGRPVPVSELNESARQLGWDVSDEEQQEAIEYLLNHRLVEKQDPSSG